MYKAVMPPCIAVEDLERENLYVIDIASGAVKVIDTSKVTYTSMNLLDTDLQKQLFKAMLMGKIVNPKLYPIRDDLLRKLEEV